jgi:hypothetical protein
LVQRQQQHLVFQPELLRPLLPYFAQANQPEFVSLHRYLLQMVLKHLQPQQLLSRVLLAPV